MKKGIVGSRIFIVCYCFFVEVFGREGKFFVREFWVVFWVVVSYFFFLWFLRVLYIDRRGCEEF